MSRNEIVVISGKGGTGKTTLVASILPYFDNPIIGDCDVDAPDLHILLDPKLERERSFIGLKKGYKDSNECIECGRCYSHCKFGAITEDYIIDSIKCEGCGVCEFVCPLNCVEMRDSVTGKLFHSSTNYGYMVHAKLIPGEEASGKLVAKVRSDARNIAEERGKVDIIIDGSPGVACNVISSITGASKVVIVVEPTLSGLHDLERVYQLTERFKLKVVVVINKFDLSMDLTNRIKNYCQKHSIHIGLMIPFSKEIVGAIVNRKIPSIEEQPLFRSIGFESFIEKLKE